MEKLPHTQRTKILVDTGYSDEAVILHNHRVETEIAAAQNGKIINLSDLMAAAEELHKTNP